MQPVLEKSGRRLTEQIHIEAIDLLVAIECGAQIHRNAEYLDAADLLVPRRKCMQRANEAEKSCDSNSNCRAPVARPLLIVIVDSVHPNAHTFAANPKIPDPEPANQANRSMRIETN